MKKITKRIFSFVMALGMILSLVPVVSLAADTPRVFILGDSTAETKKGDSEHLTGWGEVLHNFFDDPYMIKNYAVSGESSKHFYDGYWLSSIKGQVKKGDYVIIQFGHNDIKAPSVTGDMGESTTDWSYYTYPSDNLTDTDSNGCYSFGYYLNKYVTEIREAEGIPIFVTSIERRKDAYISADPAVTPHSQLAGYMAAMNSIAGTLNVPVIDVYTQTRIEILKEDIDTPNPWYMSYYGDNDDTHLTEAGAMAVAKMVAEGIKASQDTNVKGLAAYLKASFEDITNVAAPFYIDTDFEGGADGNQVSGYDNWFFTDNSNDKDIKYKKETLQDGTTNVYANFTATANYTKDDRDLATLERNFTSLTNKYVHFSYKLRSDSANNGTFQAILNGTSGYVEYQTAINSSTVSGASFKDYNGNAMTTGKWYQYDYYINTATGDLTLKVDGRNILKHKVYDKIIGLKQIRLGFTRDTPVVDNTAAGADAAVAIDDLSLYLIDESEFNQATGVLPSNVIIKETFEDGNSGDALSSTLSPGWSYGGGASASYTATYWKESGVTPANMAMLFTNSDSTKQTLTYTTNTLATPVTSGYIHIGWRMQSVGTSAGMKEAYCYFNPSGYDGKITIDASTLTTGKWHNLNAYINLSTNELTLYRDKVALKKNEVIPISNKFSSVGFSMYRKGHTYQIAFDDIIVETISQADYNDVIGVLAENVIFSEKGNFVESGTALATSATEATNAYSNFYAPSDGMLTTWIEFADSPTDSSNTALNFGRRIKSPQKGTEMMKRDISPALTDGFYSLSLKLYSKGTNNTRFNIGAVDDAGQSCGIGFNFAGNTIVTRTFYPTGVGLSSSEGTTNVSYVEGWNDIELLFDLRATDHCKLTVYLNGTPVLSNVSWGYYPAHTNTTKNNGSIAQIYMGVPGDTTGSNATGANTDPADVSWFADDLLFQKVEAKVSAVTVTDGKLASVKLDLGWLPTASQKVIVAVYSADASGNITTVKDSQILTAGKGVQTLNITKDIAVDTGDVVKVFFWNMNTLVPYMTNYTQSIS